MDEFWFNLLWFFFGVILGIGLGLRWHGVGR